MLMECACPCLHVHVPVCLCDTVFHSRVAPSVCLGGSESWAAGDVFGRWLCRSQQRNTPCCTSVIALGRESWSAMDPIGRATSVLVLYQLVAYRSSIPYFLGKSWRYITHMNTELNYTRCLLYGTSDGESAKAGGHVWVCTQSWDICVNKIGAGNS